MARYANWKEGRATNDLNTTTYSADELERQVIHNINEYGWHCVNVIEDDGQPPWTYTIGFHDTWNHPELILIGRSRATAHHILETIATGLEHDRRLDLSTTAETLLPGTACHFVEVADRYYSDYVGFAKWYYRRRQFPLYQIVWPNSDVQYPRSPHASRSFKKWQPVLGTKLNAGIARREPVDERPPNADLDTGDYQPS